MAERYFPECPLTDPSSGVMDHVWTMYFLQEQSSLAGKGNVSGPATSVSGHVATFNVATGDSLADGGLLGTAAFTAATDYDAAGAATAAVASHVALPDPHIQYQKESEKDAASGYAGLNAASRITSGVFTADYIVSNDSAKGFVLKSPNNHYWALTIDNAGVITSTDLGLGPI